MLKAAMLFLWFSFQSQGSDNPAVGKFKTVSVDKKNVVFIYEPGSVESQKFLYDFDLKMLTTPTEQWGLKPVSKGKMEIYSAPQGSFLGFVDGVGGNLLHVTQFGTGETSQNQTTEFSLSREKCDTSLCYYDFSRSLVAKQNFNHKQKDFGELIWYTDTLSPIFWSAVFTEQYLPLPLMDRLPYFLKPKKKRKKGIEEVVSILLGGAISLAAQYPRSSPAQPPASASDHSPNFEHPDTPSFSQQKLMEVIAEFYSSAWREYSLGAPLLVTWGDPSPAFERDSSRVNVSISGTFEKPQLYEKNSARRVSADLSFRYLRMREGPDSYHLKASLFGPAFQKESEWNFDMEELELSRSELYDAFLAVIRRTVGNPFQGTSYRIG